MDTIGVDFASGAIEPESVMPVQYADLRRSAAAMPPVLRLMNAVLRDRGVSHRGIAASTMLC